MKPNPAKIMAIFSLVALTLLFFWKILLTNMILVGVDTFLYFYPYKTYVAEALRQGRLPLWNPHLFMGAPLLANSQVGLFYPLNWPFIWLDAPKQVAWSIGLHIALAGIFMLTYTRHSLRLGWPGAMVAAILFAFGGYLGAQVEHINQLNAAAWLPLLFLFYDFGIERRRRRRWFWFLLLALVVALTLLAGHAQTVFISLVGLGLYALWRGVSHTINQPISPSKNIRITPHAARQEHASKVTQASAGTQSSRTTLLRARNRHASRITHHASRITFTHYLWPLLVASVLAVALAALQLIPTAELSALSIRRGGLTFREVVSFSLPPTTLPYTLLPPLGLDLSQVWGEAFGERVAYVGMSGLILALLGSLQAIWRRQPRRFVFVTASGLILSFGIYTGPLYLALYYLVPGFDLFRVPARWLLLYAFGGSILAGCGFDALLAPSILGDQLTSSWQWLRGRWWRLIIFIGLPLAFFLGLIARKMPPLTTLITWFVLTIVTVGLVYYVSCLTPHSSRFRFHAAKGTQASRITLILLLVAELFWAAQSLNYNHPTAPQAYHSMRNAVAFLLAAQSDPPPDRFLSLSGIAYDPGDWRELEQIYGDSLSPRAFYNLLVATKEKEVLFFNLPLAYGLHSVDGYDGGILPLTQFVTLQKLFLPPDDLSIDGRLREKLRFVPPGRLLSLLNTRWIITDKVFDAWIDDIFYDLQFSAYLASGQTIATTDIPDFPATAIGLVSHLEGAAALPADTPVAQLTVSFADTTSQTFILKTSRDTAEGSYASNVAHPQARVGVAWPYDVQGVDYVTLLSLTHRQPIRAISLRGILSEGQFVLRGLSLINEPTTTSRSILLSTEGNYRQVHSGDVKIYENQDVLPRAFIVHQAEVVQNDEQAVALMRDPGFDPRQKLVRVAGESESPGLITAGRSSPQDRVRIVSYEPERVEIRATLATPGWLVLTDTDYPGWQVSIDGQAGQILPVNIMFRGVRLPASEHRVVLEFKPRSLQIGLWVSGLALLVLGGGLVITNRKSDGQLP
jgi:hypothetical protein